MKAAFAEGHPEPAGALSVAALELCKDMIERRSPHPGHPEAGTDLIDCLF